MGTNIPGWKYTFRDLNKRKCFGRPSNPIKIKETGQTFKSVSEAAIELKIDKSTISRSITLDKPFKGKTFIKI